MHGLDDLDREILQLLLTDSRRPFSEIAEVVDLSAPAVSDRVERLEELGLIRQFTLDLDRSMLHEGTPLLVTIHGTPGSGMQLFETLGSIEAVQHRFRTADDTIVCTLVSDRDVGSLLEDRLPLERIRNYEVQLLASTSWTPRVGDAELQPDCVECGNTVSVEGTTERLDDRLYHFCCESCKARFLDQYERLSDGA